MHSHKPQCAGYNILQFLEDSPEQTTVGDSSRSCPGTNHSGSLPRPSPGRYDNTHKLQYEHNEYTPLVHYDTTHKLQYEHSECTL